LERRDARTGSALSLGREPVRVFNGGSAVANSDSLGFWDGSTPDGPAQTIGRYALHTEIASGGMAAVHIGRLLGPVGFARTVAIKRLHPPLAKDPEFVAMFLDEARLAARIRHPNVVSTLDVVATEGELFVVMEYVPGESLARLLRAVRTNKQMVPLPVAATIMVGVLHGLHAAHEARDERGEPLRIVHRDVSPHNILVGTDGDAHVIDFGIAKARGRMQVTRQGQIKGKLSYMPSEQLLGQGLDHRADIFAASIVLWEALTGQRLFQGVDDGEVYAKVLLGHVEPPSLYASGLSAALDAIVLRGLARDRNDRYATAREMALALEAAVPLAPPSQVGRWVEGLVGEALAERTEQIAGIERLDDGGESGETSRPPISSRSPSHAIPSDAASAVIERTPSLSLLDRTAPTEPGTYVTAALDPRATVVDRPAFSARPDDPLATVAGVPRRGSHLFVVVAAAIVIAVALFGARDLRKRGASVAIEPPPKPATVEIRQSAPPQRAAPDALDSAGWVPVMTSPPPALDPKPEPRPITASVTAAVTAPQRKWISVQPAASARPAVVRAQASTPPAETPGAPPATSPAHSSIPAAANCDPPFWIDADGTKRYNRHCANL
jgi:eukaryotic-like serine/threonine-protein kinase